MLQVVSVIYIPKDLLCLISPNIFCGCPLLSPRLAIVLTKYVFVLSSKRENLHKELKHGTWSSTTCCVCDLHSKGLCISWLGQKDPAFTRSSSATPISLCNNEFNHFLRKHVYFVSFIGGLFWSILFSIFGPQFKMFLLLWCNCGE